MLRGMGIRGAALGGVIAMAVAIGCGSSSAGSSDPPTPAGESAPPVRNDPAPPARTNDPVPAPAPSPSSPKAPPPLTASECFKNLAGPTPGPNYDQFKP